MSQESIDIALPESMKEFVLQRVSEGGYSTASDYVRELIRADQKRKAEEQLEAMLLAGLDSGPSTPFTPQDWADIRSAVQARLNRSDQ